MATGDHLFIKYAWGEHHGIDLGDGSIIEYGGKGSAYMSVRRVLLREFLARGPAFLMQYPPGTALPPSQTVRLALMRLAEQRYDLFNNNCEHLAYWCKTGKHYSPQVNAIGEVIKFSAVVGVFVLALSVAG